MLLLLQVECGRGYSPVAGWSPQELICQQGRWSPLAPVAGGGGGAAVAGGSATAGGSQRLQVLLCRKPCGPYEAADPSVLGPAFIASGVGEGHGDQRSVYCASGFVAAGDAAPKSETIVCSNGVWGRRQLQCIKDLNGMLEASPCNGALSLLPPTLKVDGIPTTHQPAEPRGPPDNLLLSQEVAEALAATFQPAGVSLKLFRIGCARGFISAAVQRKKQQQQQQQKQQQQQQQQQQQPFIYAACKDGKLLDLGPKEPLPMAAFATGEAAKALVQQLKLRLDSAPEAITSIQQAAAAALPPPPSAAEAAAGGEPPMFLDGGYPREEAAAGGAAFTVVGAAAPSVRRSLAEASPLLLGAVLDCQRELRQDPPKPPKPVSDTLLVFSCLLLLFVLVVALLALWWLRARRRQQRAAKLQQQQQQDSQEPGPTTSDLGREFFSGAEADGQSLADSSSAEAAAVAAADTAADHYRSPLTPQQTLHHSGKATAVPALYATAAYAGTSLPYLLEAAQQQQQQQHKPAHMSAATPPVFPSDAAAAAAAAATGSADENSLAFFAPVYYTGLTGDRGLVTLDGDSNSTGGGGGAAAIAEDEYRQIPYPNQQQQQQLLLLQQQQRQLRQQHVALSSSAEGGPQPGAAGAYIAAAVAPQQQIAAAEVTAATAAAATAAGGGWGPQDGVARRISLSTREGALQQQQQQQRQRQRQLQPGVSRRGNSFEGAARAALGDGAVPSGAASVLSEDDELYPEDSASCMVVTASQRREAAAAASAANAAAGNTAPKGCRHKAGATRQLSAAQSFTRGRTSQPTQFPEEVFHRRHAQT